MKMAVIASRQLLRSQYSKEMPAQSLRRSLRDRGNLPLKAGSRAKKIAEPVQSECEASLAMTAVYKEKMEDRRVVPPRDDNCLKAQGRSEVRQH